MAVFSSTAQASAVFVRLFEILLADDTFGSRLRERGLSLHLRQTEPDVEIFVDATGVRETDIPRDASVHVGMSCDTAHSLWSGRVGLRLAVRRGRVVARGDVAAVFEFVPLLAPAFERYPELVEAIGILTEPPARHEAGAPGGLAARTTA